VPLAKPHHVVVDGSNLATEGRTLPSLAQLDEAVRAYAEEDPGSHITVVVDASFEHRIDESERETLREAMLNGEVVSPPAGAIGRGDAFVLRIAERTGAVVLSNDSFQEFHAEHPWLFNEDRLVGGKPVPGVGWIFTPRLPIRGPKSRAATAEKRPKKDPTSAPAKAAELAKAAKKAAKRAPRKAVDTKWPITPAAPPPAPRGRRRGAVVDPALSSAISDAVAEALEPVKPKKATKEAAKKKTAAAKKVVATKKEAPAKKATAKKAAPAKKSSAAKKSPQRPAAPKESTKRSSSPLPAVNEPLSFITFVAAYPVGSTVEGEVVSYTSHGAMVDVALPDGGNLHCYIPLSAMGDPPPTKAREVLAKGTVRPFLLAGLDPPRRVAELALPPAPVKKRRSPAKKAAKSR
jgi:Zc3h12a-like ribonuclease protein